MPTAFVMTGAEETPAAAPVPAPPQVVQPVSAGYLTLANVLPATGFALLGYALCKRSWHLGLMGASLLLAAHRLISREET